MTKKDVMMWDYKRKEGIYIITLAQNVHNVRMNQNAIAVICKNFVFLYNITSFELIQRLTLNYHMGRVVLTTNDQHSHPFMFYSDSLEEGWLNIYNIETNKNQRSILAHKSAILSIATNAVGDIVATASTFGEVIRLWASVSGHKLCSFEKSRATVFTSLQISRTSKFIMACDKQGSISVYRIPLESIAAEPDTETPQDDNMLRFDKDPTPQPERDSFVSDAIDFETFDKLGFNEWGDSGMLIKDETPQKKEESKQPQPDKINHLLSWASSQFACFTPIMQSWTDITKSEKPFSSTLVSGKESESSPLWLICGEVPIDAQRSMVYVFNRADGRVHVYNTFGGIREEGAGETWELLPESTQSIFDLK